MVEVLFGTRMCVQRSILMAAALCVAAATAQADWAHLARDTGGMYWGAADSREGLAFACAAYAAGAAVDRAEPRAAPSPPDHVRALFAATLVGAPADNSAALRDDLMIVAGASGYRLPPARYDPATGWWAVTLPVGDPLHAAIAAEQWIEVQGAHGGARLSARGFDNTFRTLISTCRQRFQRRGLAWAAPVPVWPHAQPVGSDPMRAAALADAARGCEGPHEADESAFLSANLDGDGVPDIVLDWAGVTCLTGPARPFCGAAACSADVYLSALYPRTGGPAKLLGIGLRIVPLSNGNAGVVLGRTGCFDGDCETVWHWNGAAFAPLP